jgi:uncharacterized protein (DUF305 family)
VDRLASRSVSVLLHRTTPVAVLAALAFCGCGGAGGATARTGVAPNLGTQTVSAPVVRPQPYTEADIHFMSGMIRHHAQAVLMAGWAPTHGASRAVRALCARIEVGQRDEIVFMQQWLRDRGEPAPEADASHDMMPGMEHHLMPGMLTADQLGQLDRARGPDFDRLFLEFMIMHHQGAITMVEELMGSYGAAQEDLIFKFASDINADQTIEIERMRHMLLALVTGDPNP